MVVRAANVWAEVEEGSGAEVAFLYDYLSMQDPGAKFSLAYQRGVWDGKTRLYDRRLRRFPSGLIRLLVERGRELGIPVRVVDARERPEAPAEAPAFSWLRPYQQEALDAIFRRTRGIVSAATGSGKTECFTAFGLAVPQCRVLVLVDTRDLMHQAADRFDGRSGGELAGRYGDGVSEVRRYTVATVQTIDSRWSAPEVQRLIRGAQAVVVDEVQILPAASAYRIVMAAESAYWRLGFSATPNVRRDHRDLKAVAALGPVLYHVAERELVEAGAISPAAVRFVQFEHGRYPNWTVAREDGIVGNAGRNQLMVDLVGVAARPTILHTRMTPHGRAMLALLRGAGLRSEFVWGETPTATRDALKRRLERRDLDVLVASRVFRKGVDIPQARAIVNAAGGDSVEDAVQLLGRVSRAVDGKDECEYWDARDTGDRILSRHAKHRMEALRGRGWDVQEMRSAPLGDRVKAGQ